MTFRFRMFRLWWKWLKLDYASEMLTRSNYILKSIALLLVDLAGPIVSVLIYSATSGIPGWSFYELLLLQGTFGLVFSLEHLFSADFVRNVIEHIQSGRFDNYLVKPYDSLKFILATSADSDSFARFFVNSFIVIFSLGKIGWLFNPYALALYAFLVGLGFMIMLSIEIIIASASFLFVKTYSLINMFWESTEIGKYPLAIYGWLGSVLLTFVFPLGLAGFYPAQAILSRLELIIVLELSAVAIAFFMLALVCWNTGIKKYMSAGG